MSHEVILLAAGTEALSWSDGMLQADGLGRWVLRDGAWHPAPDRPRAEIEVHEGFLVGPTRAGRRALGLVRPGERWVASPRGALAVGGLVARAAAAPGRSLQGLPWLLRFDTLRFDESGDRVAGVDPDGVVRVLHLVERGVSQLPGLPLHPDAWLDATGALCTATLRLPLGLAEASPARCGDLLAGPGTRVWCLSTRRPLTEPGSVALGATCPWQGGFVTIDWQTHRGWSVLAPSLAFELPLGDDDVVVQATEVAGGLRCWSAEGRCVAVDASGEVSLRAWSPPPRRGRTQPVPTPLGILADGHTAQLGPWRYAWSGSGWLLGWMTTPSASGNS